VYCKELNSDHLIHILPLCLITGCIGRQCLKTLSSSQPVLIMVHTNLEMTLHASAHLKYHSWQSGYSHREVFTEKVFLSLDDIYSGYDLSSTCGDKGVLRIIIIKYSKVYCSSEAFSF